MKQSIEFKLSALAEQGNANALEKSITENIAIRHNKELLTQLLNITIDKGHLAASKILFTLGASINAESHASDFISNLASNNIAIAKLILSHCNITINTANEALLESIRADEPNAVKYLLDTFSLQPKTLDEALLESSRLGRNEVIKHLISAGADIENSGYQSLSVAILTNHTETLRLLITHIPEQSIGYSPIEMKPNKSEPLRYAANRNNTNMLSILIEANIFNNIDLDGIYVIASNNNRLDIMLYLFSLGLDQTDKTQIVPKYCLDRYIALKCSKMTDELNNIEEGSTFYLNNLLHYYFNKNEDTPLNYLNNCPKWQRPYILKYLN